MKTISPIKGISSMATRAVLVELVTAFEQQAGQSVLIESVGGMDAAKRVQSGEDFDLVVLAADAIDKLIANGHLLAGSRLDLVRSRCAIAVHADAPHPDISSEMAVRDAVLSAHSIGYSTGPSGVQLLRLFERWGIAKQLAGRVVQAPPGVPVGSLVTAGEVELGFQQLSELIGLPGLSVVGPLPPAIEIVTTFSAGIGARSTQGESLRSLLDFLASPARVETIRKHGMEPCLITANQEDTR